MTTDFTFITGNENKLREVQSIFSIEVKHQKIDLLEIQSLNPEEISQYKAKEAFAIVNTPVLIEDVSLTIHAMGKLPGPFIKYFLSELKVEGLCKVVSQYQDKSATAQVYYTLYNGHQMHTFIGSVPGTISGSPKGESGFGFDPIFIPQGSTLTYAQMTPKEKNQISPRSQALLKLKKFLDNIN